MPQLSVPIRVWRLVGAIGFLLLRLSIDEPPRSLENSGIGRRRSRDIGLPALSTGAAVVAALFAGLSWWNSKQIRFDAFNLELLKLQVEASSILIAKVDDFNAGYLKQINEMTSLDHLIYSRLKAQADGADLSQQQLFDEARDIQQLAAFSNPELTQKSQDILDGLNRQGMQFAFVVPVDVGTSILSAVPKYDMTLMVKWNQIIGRSLMALRLHDRVSAARILPELANIDKQLSQTRQQSDVFEDRWQIAKTRFLCALQNAQNNHTALEIMPRDCYNSKK